MTRCTQTRMNIRFVYNVNVWTGCYNWKSVRFFPVSVAEIAVIDFKWRVKDNNLNFPFCPDIVTVEFSTCHSIYHMYVYMLYIHMQLKRILNAKRVLVIPFIDSTSACVFVRFFFCHSLHFAHVLVNLICIRQTFICGSEFFMWPLQYVCAFEYR